MKEKILPIVHLYVDDSIFNVKALITPQRISCVCDKKITDITKFEVLNSKWHLEIVRLRDDYISLYQNQGNYPRQFYDKCLLFVLDLVREEEKFKALYLMHSGKIVIFPSEYLETEIKHCYFEKMVVEKDTTFARKKVKERYCVGAFNCLFFIKNKRYFYLMKDRQATLQYVKSSYRR